MLDEGRLEGPRPLVMAVAGPAEVDVGRGEIPEPGMTVFLVVPGDEVDAEGAGVLDRAETIGEVGPVLERLEVGLGVGVVVGDVRSRCGSS